MPARKQHAEAGQIRSLANELLNLRPDGSQNSVRSHTRNFFAKLEQGELSISLLVHNFISSLVIW